MAERHSPIRYIDPVLERHGVYGALRTAAVVAGLAAIGIAPYVYYLTAVAFADTFRERFAPLSAHAVLRTELASLGFVVLVAALVGSVFAERYGLRGVGDRTEVREARWLILVGAPLLGLISYLLFGRVIAQRVPGYYPETVRWAVVRALKGALFDEVVARFGMMTILCGVVRRPGWANVLQAGFFTVLALLGLSFFGLTFRWSAFFVASVVATFATHWVLGAVYARYGLVAAMAFHLMLGLKYLVHVVLVGSG